MKTIVVATDFSAGADAAVDGAVLLAKERQAKVWLLHVFNDGFWQAVKNVYAIAMPNGQEMTLTLRERLSKQARLAAQRLGVMVGAQTRTGEPAEEIARFAAEQKADLLIVGEHGENWITETVVGGTALRVVTAARLPVLLIRRKTENFATVLTAVDLSARAQRLVHTALTWFPTAKHWLLHAYTVAYEGRMRLAGAAQEDILRYREEERAHAARVLRTLQEPWDGARQHDLRLILRHGQAAAVILEEARRSGVDVIVIGRHGGGAVEEIVLGSVTQNVLYHAPTNVLIVP